MVHSSHLVLSKLTGSLAVLGAFSRTGSLLVGVTFIYAGSLTSLVHFPNDGNFTPIGSLVVAGAIVALWFTLC